MFIFTNRETRQITSASTDEMRDPSNQLLADISLSIQYRSWLNSFVMYGASVTEGEVVRLAKFPDHLASSCCSNIRDMDYSESESESPELGWNIRPYHYAMSLVGSLPAIVTRVVPTSVEAPVVIVEQPTQEVVDERELTEAYGERAAQLDDTTRIRLLAILREKQTLQRNYEERWVRNAARITELTTQVEQMDNSALNSKAINLIAEIARVVPLIEEKDLMSYFSSGVQSWTFTQWARTNANVRFDSAEMREAQSQVEEHRLELAQIIGEIAQEKDWCEEYDRMARIFEWPDRDTLGISTPEVDYSVRGVATITIEVPVTSYVTASDEDEAFNYADGAYDAVDQTSNVMEYLGVPYNNRSVAQMIENSLRDGEVEWENAEEI